MSARYYNPKWSVWLSVNPLAEKYPTFSGYNYVFSNPVGLTDPSGMGPERVVDDYIFKKDAQGIFVFTGKIIPNEGPDRAVTQDENGTTTGAYILNDQDNDGSDIATNKIRTLNVVSKDAIDSEIASKKPEGGEFALTYMEREGRPRGNKALFSDKLSSGALDFKATSDLVSADLNVAEGSNSAYNRNDFGNFLIGQAGRKLGLSVGTVQFGAHINNAFNGNDNNPGVSTGILDSAGDQNAIRAGYYYPASIPVYDQSLYFDTNRNPGAYTPWNKL